MRGIFILFLCLGSLVAADNTWHFIDFVTRWTGSACVQSPRRDNPVPSTVKNFTIHGAWPDRNDGTWPSFCNDSYPFNWNQISDMKAELDTNWPSFTGPNPDFYTHEWNKHGTCALNVLKDEHEYFQRTLQLNNRWDLTASLTNAGFYPSDSKEYNVNDMTAAMSKAIGNQVAIQCVGVNKKLYFSAVHICFNPQFQLIACPQFVVHSCQAGCYKATALLPPV